MPSSIQQQDEICQHNTLVSLCSDGHREASYSLQKV